jgi:hypothetical protein
MLHLKLTLHFCILIWFLGTTHIQCTRSKHIGSEYRKCLTPSKLGIQSKDRIRTNFTLITNILIRYWVVLLFFSNELSCTRLVEFTPDHILEKMKCHKCCKLMVSTSIYSCSAGHCGHTTCQSCQGTGTVLTCQMCRSSSSSSPMFQNKPMEVIAKDLRIKCRFHGCNQGEWAHLNDFWKAHEATCNYR